MDINKMKIDIKIKDPTHFGDVAILVDQPRFLEEVKRLRDKWKIKTLIPSKRYYEDWSLKLVKEGLDKWEEQVKLRKSYKRNYKKLWEAYQKLYPNNIAADEEEDTFQEDYEERIARIIPKTDFECDLRDVRTDFKVPETFDIVIAYAVVCGEIPEGIYKTTYWKIDQVTSPILRLQGYTQRVAIYVTPQSTESEVIAAFQQIKERSFGKGEWSPLFFSLYSKDNSGEAKRAMLVSEMKNRNGKGDYKSGRL